MYSIYNTIDTVRTSLHKNKKNSIKSKYKKHSTICIHCQNSKNKKIGLLI